MSVASEITRLYGVRDNIFTSITNKGVTVPSNSKLADVPTLVGSIPSGGTANAFTLDYVNPNQYCTFVNNPDCARPNATITPQYNLTNGYILDNLTLNGSNIQGSSFTMPSIDSVVGMVVHQVEPLILKFSTPEVGYGAFQIRNLQVNGSTPSILEAYYENQWGSRNDFSDDDMIDLIAGNPFLINITNQVAYIVMNAASTDVVSLMGQLGYGGAIPAQILYSNQVIHSADLNMGYGEFTTYVNLVPQS